MRAVIAAAAAAMLLAPTARAETRDIPWFAAHPAEREATLRLCRSDFRYSHLPDCANADMAGTRYWQQRGAGSDVWDSPLDDPNYWAENRMARLGAVDMCRKGQSDMPARSCAAAYLGDAMDKAAHPRGR